MYNKVCRERIKLNEKRGIKKPCFFEARL